MVQEMIRIFEAQRLVSLSTLFDLADNLDRVASGEKLNTALVNRLASRISEIQSPRAGLSSLEKNSYSFGYWTERHLESERKLNIRGNDRPRRRRCREAEGDPRRTCSAASRHAGRLQLYALCAARGADSADQPRVRPQPRFPRVPGHGADLEDDRGGRQRLAFERGRPAGGVARRGCRTRWPRPSRIS